MKPTVERLLKGQDLKKSISAIVRNKKIKAGVIVCAVGSLNKTCLRMPVENHKQTVKKIERDVEIVSLIGTVSPHGVHLHMSVSDSSGKVVGGHLIEGCLVKTTVELAILSFESLRFSRVFDNKTGYKELVVDKRK